jgi:hypothetical protein
MSETWLMLILNADQRSHRCSITGRLSRFSASSWDLVCFLLFGELTESSREFVWRLFRLRTQSADAGCHGARSVLALIMRSSNDGLTEDEDEVVASMLRRK